MTDLIVCQFAIIFFSPTEQFVLIKTALSQVLFSSLSFLLNSINSLINKKKINPTTRLYKATGEKKKHQNIQ